MRPRVCFIGGARYSCPLDNTNRKKFLAMKSLADIFVIGFSSDLRFQRFREHARFYALPKLPWPILRYLELFVFGPVLIVWFAMRHGVRIVVAQSPYEGFVAAVASEFARWLGREVRLIVEIHGDFEESLFLQREIRFAGLYRVAMRCLAHYSIKKAALLRAVSNGTKRQLQHWAPEKAVVQFPAWTDIKAFLQAGEFNKVVPQRILYAGSLTPLKGIHHLVNAFVPIAEEFPQARLFIVGKEENQIYAGHLKRQISEAGLCSRVQFMPPQPQTKLAVWMAQAAVLVLPSASEGLPRVVIEAMATGTPIIGSRIGGIAELIEDGTTGFLVAPGDEHAIGEKLRWIFTHPEKARSMGTYARGVSERLFSTTNYLKGYQSIFEMASAVCSPIK